MHALDAVKEAQVSSSGSIGQPDLRPEAQAFASLIGSLGAAAAPSPSGAGRAVDLGRARAEPRKRSIKGPGSSTDPTQVAVAELGSRGAAKETVAAASRDLTNPGRTGESAGSPRGDKAGASAGFGRSTQGDPRAALVPQGKADGGDQGAKANPASPTSVQPPPAVAANVQPSQSVKMPNLGATSIAGASSVAAGRVGKLGPLAALERAQPAPLRTNLRVVSAPAAALKQATPAAPQRPPASAMNDPDVEFAEQLQRGFAAVLRQNGGSLTMRLQPEALGELTIRMDLKPGQVAATFEVESDQAQQLLRSQLSALRSALEARGLTVDSLTVEVSQRPAQDANAEDQAETWQQRGGARDPDGGAVGEDARGQRHDADGRGTDATPEKADIHTRSDDLSWSTAGAGTEFSGGARVVRLAIDAIA